MNKPHTDLSSIVAIKDTSSFKNINILEDCKYTPPSTTTPPINILNFALRAAYNRYF